MNFANCDKLFCCFTNGKNHPPHKAKGAAAVTLCIALDSHKSRSKLRNHLHHWEFGHLNSDYLYSAEHSLLSIFENQIIWRVWGNQLYRHGWMYRKFINYKVLRNLSIANMLYSGHLSIADTSLGNNLPIFYWYLPLIADTLL